MKTKATRKGKHREDKTMIAAYITPEVKALAMLIQDRTGMSFTDMIVEGISYFATNFGILRNGQVTAEYSDAFTNIVTMLNVERVNKNKGEY